MTTQNTSAAVELFPSLAGQPITVASVGANNIGLISTDPTSQYPQTSTVDALSAETEIIIPPRGSSSGYELVTSSANVPALVNGTTQQAAESATAVNTYSHTVFIAMCDNNISSGGTVNCYLFRLWLIGEAEHRCWVPVNTELHNHSIDGLTANTYLQQTQRYTISAGGGRAATLVWRVPSGVYRYVMNWNSNLTGGIQRAAYMYTV